MIAKVLCVAFVGFVLVQADPVWRREKRSPTVTTTEVPQTTHSLEEELLEVPLDDFNKFETHVREQLSELLATNEDKTSEAEEITRKYLQKLGSALGKSSKDEASDKGQETIPGMIATAVGNTASIAMQTAHGVFNEGKILAGKVGQRTAESGPVGKTLVDTVGSSIDIATQVAHKAAETAKPLTSAAAGVVSGTVNVAGKIGQTAIGAVAPVGRAVQGIMHKLTGSPQQE